MQHLDESCVCLLGIFQLGILEWAALSFSSGSFRLRDRTQVSCFSCIGRSILSHGTTWEALDESGRRD